MGRTSGFHAYAYAPARGCNCASTHHVLGQVCACTRPSARMSSCERKPCRSRLANLLLCPARGRGNVARGGAAHSTLRQGPPSHSPHLTPSQLRLPDMCVHGAVLAGDADAAGPYLTLRRLVVWLGEPLRRMRLLALLADSTQGLGGGALAGALYAHAQVGLLEPFQGWVWRRHLGCCLRLGRGLRGQHSRKSVMQAHVCDSCVSSGSLAP